MYSREVRSVDLCFFRDRAALSVHLSLLLHSQELYHPPKGSRLNHLDGAYWGTSIAQIFYMQFPFLLPPPRAPNAYYVPTVYGFKVSPQVKTRLRLQQMPRMLQQAKQRAEEEREALLGSVAAAERAAGIPVSVIAGGEGGGGVGDEESRRREMF